MPNCYEKVSHCNIYDQCWNEKYRVNEPEKLEWEEHWFLTLEKQHWTKWMKDNLLKYSFWQYNDIIFQLSWDHNATVKMIVLTVLINLELKMPNVVAITNANVNWVTRKKIHFVQVNPSGVGNETSLRKYLKFQFFTLLFKDRSLMWKIVDVKTEELKLLKIVILHS